ncbi:MAG: SDR family NAD(P)-dependent oxidoreductase [Proteobacteria bacterium]|nr:SDR family NAD(P)-dependent oxidoreductase [Pseudomonadota bacterium]
MRDLTGKAAWVTGGGTGIGRAAALALAGAGMDVAVSGRRVEPLDETAGMIRDLGGRALVLPLDVQQIESVTEAAGRMEETFGRLDVLVNNAGLNVAQRHWRDLSPEGWNRVIDIDLNGAFYCAHAALPVMRRQKDGLIVNISSWAGRFDTYLPGPAYNAAKHALLAMNASLNIEECVNGIRACAICPAEVATPILDARPVPVSDEDKARMLQTEDLGETILFVARMPARVCLNEILISPTWNRVYFGGPEMSPSQD